MNRALPSHRFLAAAAFAALVTQSPAGTPSRQTTLPAQRSTSQAARDNLSRDFGKLPLAFEPNVGQADARVRFLARCRGMTVFFTDTETVMTLSGGRTGRENAAGEAGQSVVRMKLVGAGRPRRLAGLDRLPGIANYFLGSDPAKWHTDVPQYGRVQHKGVYPGIDLVWYGNRRELEYDFVVAPGADPRQIEVAYDGVESLGVEPGGELVLRTGRGEVRQPKPRVYQEIGGKQVEVAARYTMAARNRVSFELARYDRKQELRIDPVVLVYSTYLGGGDDLGAGIAVDAAGSAYIMGITSSTNFPTQSPFQATHQGLSGDYDAFVTKLTPAGNALVYSTYLGGSGEDWAEGIAVVLAGSAYVTGRTRSVDFPTTRSAYQATHQGGIEDAFVAKLAPAGNALVYSTYLGGNNVDNGWAIAVDAAGSAYIAGETMSPNFPTQSAFQAQGSWAGFVTKLTPAGNALVYSTYLGGTGVTAAYGIAVDAAGSAYVTGYTGATNFPTKGAYQATPQGGWDAFVTKLTAAGNALIYSTFLGGIGDDYGKGIAVDAAGAAYVTGYTGSSNVSGGTSGTNFPTQSAFQATPHGALEAFVTKLTAAGNALVYSTFLGGGGDDYGHAIAVDAAGSAYVTGYTLSTNFPTQLPYQAAFQGINEVFVTKLAPAGNALVSSTYLGGTGRNVAYAIAVDAAGMAYVTGSTTSTNFPTQSPYQKGVGTAFVTKLQMEQPPQVSTPQISLAGIGNAANYVAGKVAPGEIIVVYGTAFGPSTLAQLQFVNGVAGTTLGATRIYFDNVAAPMISASSGVLGCVVPYGVAGKTSTQVQVEYNGVKGNTLTVPVVDAVPGIFSMNQSGTGPGAILNWPDYSVNAASNRVAAGGVIMVYATGEGKVDIALDGQLVPLAGPYPKPLLGPWTATVGGKPAAVSYYGSAPGSIAGLFQMNVQVPDLTAGIYDLVIQAGAFTSTAGLTVAVR